MGVQGNFQTLPAVPITRPSAADFWRVLAWCWPSARGDGGGGEVLTCSDSDRAGEVMSEEQRQGAERDLYRDTWVRYLGECGSD